MPVKKLHSDAPAVPGNNLPYWAQTVSVQDVLKLVRNKGVEECAELIRFLPPDKLRAVIDHDVWKNRSDRGKGRSEVFDAAQFLRWLQTLLSTGPDEAVDALRDLGVEFTAGAFGHYLEPIPMEVYAMNRAESGLGTEDKNVEHGNPLELGTCGDCYVQLKPDLCLEDVHETFLEILGACEQHNPEFLSGVFYTIVRQADSNVIKEDFRAERDHRLAQAGYVTAQKAYEYLLRHRTESGLARFSRTQNAEWPIEDWKHFLHHIAKMNPTSDPASRHILAEDILDSLHRSSASMRQRKDKDLPAWESRAAMHTLPYSTSSLTAVSPQSDLAKARTAMLLEWASSLPGSMARSFQSQWIFLANILSAGWEHQGQLLGPKKAMDVLEHTMATALGICTEQDPYQECTHQPEPPNESYVRSACSLFEVGWHYLFRSVTLKTARMLDHRLRLRHPNNSELRTAWFTACRKRQLIQDCSISRWCAEGRYKMVAGILDDLEFALPAEASLGLRILLDATPALPAGIDSLIEASRGYHPRPHIGKKLCPRTRWLCFPGDEKPYLAELKKRLMQLD
jgi:hypothetical protein